MLKNVIIVSQVAYCGGGASQIAISNANLLVKKGYNVFFVCAKNSLNGNGLSLDVSMQEFSITTQNSNKNILNGFINKLYNKKFKKDFISYLKEFSSRETIVHLHNWPAFSYSIFSALKEWGGQYCVTMHDYYAICPNSCIYNYKKNKICTKYPLSLKCLICSCDRRNYFYKINQFLRLLWQKIYFKNAFTNVIYVSQFSKKLFELKGFISKKAIVIDNVIDFPSNIGNVHEMENFFLFVGRIVPEKGCDIFCQALSDLNLKGVVVGDGELKDVLQKQFEKTKIEFVGWKSKIEILEYMKKAKALVFPSRWYETAGLSVLEALYSKLPVILSSDIAACSYVVNDVTGFYFENGNVESLKNAIKKINTDKVNQEIRTNIESNFDSKWYSEEVFVSKHIQFYEELL